MESELPLAVTKSPWCARVMAGAVVSPAVVPSKASLVARKRTQRVSESRETPRDSEAHRDGGDMARFGTRNLAPSPAAGRGKASESAPCVEA